jgi:hypothetical protein
MLWVSFFSSTLNWLCKIQTLAKMFYAFLAYFPKMEIGLWDHHPVCLSPLSTFEPVGNFYEIYYGGRAIEGDLNAIIFNPVASTILKWQIFILLRWMQKLHQSMQNHEILYTDRTSEDLQLSVRLFLWKTKYTNVVGGWKLQIVFYGDNSIWQWDFETTEVDAKFVPVKMGPWNFVCWQIFRGWTTLFSKTTFVKNKK